MPTNITGRVPLPQYLPVPPTWRRTRPTSFILHLTAEKKRLSHTSYRVLKEIRDFTLLEIDLLTGRRRQIRVYLADNGHPIVRDKKYVKGKAVHKLIDLHALSISIRHPISGR